MQILKTKFTKLADKVNANTEKQNKHIISYTKVTNKLTRNISPKLFEF